MNLDKLNKLFKDAQSATTFKRFLLYLIEIVEQLLSECRLLEQIEEERAKDAEELKENEDQLNKRLEYIRSEIARYCINYNIKQREPDENLFDLSWESSEHPVHRKYMFIKSELIWLAEVYPNSINFISRFALVFCVANADKEIQYCVDQTRRAACSIPKPNISLECMGLYDKWYGSKERLDVKAPSTIWYAWDSIKFFYDLQNNVYDMRLGLANRGRYMDADIAAEAFQQLRRIQQGDDGVNTIGSMTRQDLKRAIRAVNNFLENAVNKPILLPSNKKLSLSYDQDTGLLTWTKAPIKIYGEDLEGQCLSLFFPNGNPGRDKFHLMDIHDDVNSNILDRRDENPDKSTASKGLSKAEKDKIRHAIRRVNHKFENVYKLPLILVEKSYFCLNPDLFKSNLI